MPIKFSNNGRSKLAAGITAAATSLTVTTGEGALFPALITGDYFYVTLVQASGLLEIVKVTARATDVFTIVRAQDGTTAKAFAINELVSLRLNKSFFDDMKAESEASAIAYAVALG